MFHRRKVLKYNTNPLQGRKWLKFLQADPISGLRIKPNLDLERHVLGFTLDSNYLGLRGPSAATGDGVVLGTSFAMGFAVDNGQNWYELSLDPSSWLNLGLPVGLRQIESLLETYYRGPFKTALVLYHPNFWFMTLAFERWCLQGGSIFDTMGWQTDFWTCLLMFARKQLRIYQALKRGQALLVQHEGVEYYIDARYDRFDFDRYPGVVELTLNILSDVLRKFERVIVIRTLLKQDILPDRYRNEELETTVRSYDQGWNLVGNHLEAHKNIDFYVTEGFTLSDFQPWDTHWNVQGNAKFAAMITSVLK